MLETRDGRQTVRHYMFDFGSIMGSGTVHAQTPRAGNEYILEWTPGLWTGLSLGFYFKPWTLIRYPSVPPAVGRFEGTAFQPETWKPEYPNTAFDNMRPEDAFWAACIVARFDLPRVRAVVEKAKYTNLLATEYITQVLMQRRDKVLRRWLNGVNPLVAPAIADGRLTAVNVAVAAGVATAPEHYSAQWFSLDNTTGVRAPIGASEQTKPFNVALSPEIGGGNPSADAGIAVRVPDGVAAEYLGVTIEGVHRDHPAWRDHPTTFTFRRTSAGWQHIGTQRYR
jgi:hypothetical protein